MDCTACGHTIAEGARFCSQCGTAVSRACTACGHPLPADARFCEQCGTAVGKPAVPPAAVGEPDDTAARKTVTVLFADLVGSTAFGERVDAESTRDVHARYHSMTRSIIEDHGGHLAKFIGDGVMALFGVPETAEDDATRAIAAGVALQAAFEPLRVLVAQRHGADLGLRVGINTGEIVIAAGDDDVVGDALNTAARLEAVCPPGRVLVGEDTWRLTRSAVDFEELGSVAVRGKAEPIATYQVIATGAVDDDSGTPFVGRAGELARLRQVFAAAVAERRARLATVIGAPGVGKTRLSREFCLGLDEDATVVRMRCRRSGTATFAPVADVLRGTTDIDDDHSPAAAATAIRRLLHDLDDAERVTDLLLSFVGHGPDRSTEEAFFAVRRLVEAQARQRPLVIVVDDIQWAEPLFLDLLEHLTEWVDDAPTLIVALARPEIREIRPVVATDGRLVRAAIALEGLDPDATAELAARLVGADALPAELIARLPQSTEGNPLFVRELMRMLVHDGVIVEGDRGWELTIEADAVEVPPTIQSLLSARLDRMPSDERRLVELASVVGSEFPLGAVQAISDDGADDLLLRTTLDRLRRRELVEPAGRYWGDEPVFRFHHVLIRDAAYRRLLKRRRAELHRLVGEWTLHTAADLPGEHEATIAFHFEQAFGYRRELYDQGDETTELGRRAARLLRTAAERALDRDDIAAAGALTERAAACLDSGDPDLPDLLMVGCEALLGLGDVSRGGALLDALTEVEGDARLQAWTDCFAAQRAVLTEPGTLHEMLRRLDAAAGVLAGAGDEAGVAKARLVRAGALARLGRIGESEAELDLALTAARAADDRRRVAAVLGVAPVAALWGPSPIPRAGGRCLDVIRLLRITTGSPSVEAVSTRCQAVLEALRGRFDTARTMLSDARATVEELGLRHEVLETQLYAGIVALLAGAPADAEPPLRAAYEGLAHLGVDADAGQAAAYLARAVLRLERVDEASELAAAGHALAGQTPQTGIVARAVQAEILAAQGRVGDAVRLAREAVEIAATTDLVIDHADANAVLAAVTTDAAEADAAREVATSLYESKGAVLPAALQHAPSPDDGPARRPERGDERAPTGPRAGRTGGDEEPWNRADEVHARYFRAHVAGDFDAAHRCFAENIEIEDRRALARRTYRGLDELGDTIPLGDYRADRSVATPLAARGDRLVVRHVVRHSTHDEVHEYLVVVRLDDENQLERIILFDQEELPAAIAELDEQFEAELVAAERLSSLATLRIARQTNAALVEGDIDRWLIGFDPTGVVSDHRAVGWPDSTIGDLRARLETFRRLPGTLFTYTPRILREDGDFLLQEQVNLTTTAEGARQEERSLFVAEVRDGLTVRLDQFDPGQLEQAGALYAELLDSAESTDRRRNPAFEVAAHVHGCARAWGVLPRYAITAGCEVAGPSGEILSHDLGAVSDPEELHRMGIGVATHRPLALMAQRLAMVELRGERDGSPVHWVAVEEIDAEARLCAVALFEPTIEGLRAAMAAMAGRIDAIQRPDAAISFIRRLQAQPDLHALRTMVSPSFQFVDHRELGFGVLDAEGYLEMNAASRAVTDEIHLPQGFSVSNDRGLLARIVSVAVRPNGELDEAAPMLLVLIIDGEQMVRQEAFDEGDEEGALARFEELTRDTDENESPGRLAEPAGGSPEPQAPVVVHAAAAFADAANDGTLAARQDELIEPDFRWEDRRAVTSTGADGSAEKIEALAPGAPGARWEHETVFTRGDSCALARGVAEEGDPTPGWLLFEVGPSGRLRRITVFDADAFDEAAAELDRRWFLSLPPEEQNTVVVALRWGRAAAKWDMDAFDELMTDDFRGYGGRELRLGWMDRNEWLELLGARAGVQGRFEKNTVEAMEFQSPHTTLLRWVATGQDGRWDSSWEERGITVMQVSNDKVRRVGAFAPDDLDGARVWAASLSMGRTADPHLDNLARHVGQRILAAVNDGTLRDRLDEFFAPGWKRTDHRHAVNTGTLDAATVAESTVSVASEARTTPVAIRGDHLLLSRGVTDYGLDTESVYLVLSEVDSSARQTRVDFYDEGALHEALSELDRRWFESLSAAAAATARVVGRWRRATVQWDVDAFEQLVADDFESFEGSRLGIGRMDRATFLSSQRAKRELEGGQRTTLVDLIEMPRDDVNVARIRSTGQGTRFNAEFEHAWIVVHQVVAGHVRRFGRFDADDLEGARAWAASLELPHGVDPAFESLALAAMRRSERAMNDGTLAEVVADWYEPDFERIDRRSVIGTGVMDIATYIETVPDFYGEIHHVPLARRGSRFLLARATLTYDGDNETALLVLSAVSEAGKTQRVVLFDADAVDEAMTELDRSWARSLSAEERTTLRVAAAFVRAWVDQDYAAFERIVDPHFRTVEHLLFGDREADLATMRASHDGADGVFGARRVVVDLIELPTPHIVLARHASGGTAPTAVEWEVTEWSVLQVRNGRVLRNEVFDDAPGGDAESRARHRARELAGWVDGVRPVNRAERTARAVFAAWTAGETGADLFAEEFERIDRRSVVSAPDVGREELLSTVLPEILSMAPHCTLGDVLLAYDDRFALCRARLANEAGTYAVEYLMAHECDDAGRLRRTAIFDADQETAARRELTLWWAPTLSSRRMEVSQLAVAFGESWVAPSSRPFGAMLAPDFALLDGRTLGLGELDREGIVQALVGREHDGTTGPPVPSRAEFVSDDILVFRAANRGITPGTEVEWEEIACNVLVTRGSSIHRVEMFDEGRWDEAVARARAIAAES